MQKFILIYLMFSTSSLAFDPAIGDPSCGQEGQKACRINSREFFTTSKKGCDRGLKNVKGSCFSYKRKALKNSKHLWVSNALKFQREILANHPIKDIPILFAHNSYNNRADGFVIPNQFYSVTDMLDLGVRFFEWDVHFFAGRLRLCHGTSNHIGCYVRDRAFFNMIEELSLWIRKSDNEKEIVFIYVQEEFGKGEAGKKGKTHFVRSMRQFLGDLVIGEEYLNENPKITANELRKLNKRIVLRSSLVDQIKRNDPHYRKIPLNGKKINIKSARPISLKRPGKTSSIFLGNDNYIKSMVDVLEHFKYGSGGLKMDYITLEHAKAAIWTWAEGEPIWTEFKKCALMNEKGRWQTSDCSNKYFATCKVGKEEFFLTSKKVSFGMAQNQCHTDYSNSSFAYPLNGKQSDQISVDKRVWINIQESTFSF